MVAVLLHHLLGVAHGLLLPLVAADVLPAGDLREDEQTQLVAPVDEVRALRIVARAHGVEAELVFQKLRVHALQALRRGVADVGPALVAVQAAQEELSPVEIKPVGVKLREPEAERHVHAVKHRPFGDALAGLNQLGAQRVEHGALHVPELRVRHEQQRRALLVVLELFDLEILLDEGLSVLLALAVDALAQEHVLVLVLRAEGDEALHLPGEADLRELRGRGVLF